MLLRLHRKQLLPLAFAAGFVSGTGALRFGALRFCLLLRLLRTFCTVDYF